MKFSLLLSSLLSLLSLAKSEPILIALPQSDHTEVLASWERGEEIPPWALAAIIDDSEAKKKLSITQSDTICGYQC